MHFLKTISLIKWIEKNFQTLSIFYYVYCKNNNNKLAEIKINSIDKEQTWVRVLTGAARTQPPLPQIMTYTLRKGRC